MPLLRFKETYTPSFPEAIPGDIDTFLQQTPPLKRFTKYLKRHLILRLTGQLSLESETIPNNAKRILWINLSSPSLGDTLMDLAGRTLLKEFEVTLLTDPFTIQLYQSDRYFNQATDNPETVKGMPFDHVVLDSYGTQGIRTKLKVAPSTPFSGMYGFFDGPEINKVLFSYYRLNQLLGSPLSTTQIEQQASTHIYPGEKEVEEIDNLNLAEPFITIAIGGEWEHRIYSRWASVIEQLPESLQIVLIGSNNGVDDAEKVMKSHKTRPIINLVGQLAIMETTALIAQSQLLLCADGGLMHIAHGTDIPTVALFATVRPQHFTTTANQTTTLYDDHAVRNISAKEIAAITTPLLKQLNDQP